VDTAVAATSGSAVAYQHAADVSSRTIESAKNALQTATCSRGAAGVECLESKLVRGSGTEIPW